MAKAIKKTYKTPLSELMWVSISGQGKLKYEGDENNPDDYIYTVTARFDKAQADKVSKDILAFWNENRDSAGFKNKEPKYGLPKPEEDEDGNETGFYTLQAKTTTVWPDGKANRIKVLRANGNVIDLGDQQIGNGSTGVVHGDLAISGNKANHGISFYLKAVQLKKFVPYTGSDVEADDLGEDEGLEDDGLGAIENLNAEQSGPSI